MGATTLDEDPTHAGFLACHRTGTSTDFDAAFDSFNIESEGDPVPAP